MKNLSLFLLLSGSLFLTSCSKNKHYESEISENSASETYYDEPQEGIAVDSVNIATRPSSVLLTGIPEYLMVNIFKINCYKRNNCYAGHNSFHYNYNNSNYENESYRRSNFMPGLEAVYGPDLVNISLYNTESKKSTLFFERLSLINTLYYPSFSTDTLNGKPLHRNYYLVSVYDEDTNHDKFINRNDLRRLYFFNINGTKATELVPKNYSVLSSEYDSANDYMYIYAQIDENNNGKRDTKENIHIFWIDLKKPINNGRLY